MNATKPATTMTEQPLPTFSHMSDGGKTVASSDIDIRGRMVKDSDGHDLGRIDDLMIDDVEQRVRFMEVETGGFLGLGEHKSIIPIEAITKIGDDEVHISHSRSHVAGAPHYDPELVKSDSNYFFNLYPYYGYPGIAGGAMPWTTSWPNERPGGGRLA